MMGMREKSPKYNKTKKRNQGKDFLVWLLSHPHDYEMAADYFPGSENKPDLP